MTANPFFSVVVPTFNRAERLRGTLKSVLGQTFANFEILVMDDGSTDHTREMVEGFADHRLKYSRAANSGGPATPRNRGIDAACGEWVCFLDADDLWYPTKLEATRQATLSDPSADVVCHDEYLVVSATNQKRRLFNGPFEPDFYRVMLLYGNRCSTSATSVRKSFLDRHGLRFDTRAEYVIVEDYDLWLRLALAGAIFRFLPVAFGEYRIEDDNISLNTEKWLRNFEALLHDHVFAIQTFEPDKERLWRRVSVRLSAARTRHHLSGARRGLALKTILESIRQSPTDSARFLLDGLRKAWKR